MGVLACLHVAGQGDDTCIFLNNGKWTRQEFLTNFDIPNGFISVLALSDSEKFVWSMVRSEEGWLPAGPPRPTLAFSSFPQTLELFARYKSTHDVVHTPLQEAHCTGQRTAHNQLITDKLAHNRLITDS